MCFKYQQYTKGAYNIIYKKTCNCNPKIQILYIEIKDQQEEEEKDDCMNLAKRLEGR